MAHPIKGGGRIVVGDHDKASGLDLNQPRGAWVGDPRGVGEKATCAMGLVEGQ